MKASYYLSGLALGVLIGGGLGYLIASDPKKKAKIQHFLDNVEEKIGEKVEKVKAKFSKETEEELIEEELREIVDSL
ncbi:hypothetical protein FACS189440_13500 [Bacteroidia bacterium]|nr:hypothetical protein FACS189440_13500 [Bacteroidia bacterium]